MTMVKDCLDHRKRTALAILDIVVVFLIKLSVQVDYMYLYLFTYLFCVNDSWDITGVPSKELVV